MPYHVLGLVQGTGAITGPVGAGNLLAQHVGSNDPETEGWTVVQFGPAPTKQAVAGGWQVTTDPVAQTAQLLYYKSHAGVSLLSKNWVMDTTLQFDGNVQGQIQEGGRQIIWKMYMNSPSAFGGSGGRGLWIQGYTNVMIPFPSATWDTTPVNLRGTNNVANSTIDWWVDGVLTVEYPYADVFPGAGSEVSLNTLEDSTSVWSNYTLYDDKA